jgi:hypothetical protein
MSRWQIESFRGAVGSGPGSHALSSIVIGINGLGIAILSLPLNGRLASGTHDSDREEDDAQ